MNFRVGIGVDAHRREAGRPLFLGGVNIPSAFGLAAYSDGDVIAHAILDAMLGAANLGDKGTLFPDTDPKYKNIRSTELLTQAAKELSDSSFEIVNVDVSVMCEEPKITPYVSEMRAELSSALVIEKSQVSIKATTLEQMGFTGRKEGIAALAVVLIQSTGEF